MVATIIIAYLPIQQLMLHFWDTTILVTLLYGKFCIRATFLTRSINFVIVAMAAADFCGCCWVFFSFLLCFSPSNQIEYNKNNISLSLSLPPYIFRLYFSFHLQAFSRKLTNKKPAQHNNSVRALCEWNQFMLSRNTINCVSFCCCCFFLTWFLHRTINKQTYFIKPNQKIYINGQTNGQSAFIYTNKSRSICW